MSVSMLWRDWLSDGTVAACGLSAEIVIAALYLTAAGRPSPRGRRWPRWRTAAFLAGLAVIVLALDSGLAARDELPVPHAVQHVLLMMLAPLLLSLGRPVTLTLRSCGPTGRARLRTLLHDPAVRRSTTRPWLVVLDYSATMAVAMLGPVENLAVHHLAIHIAIHAYLILCGAIFWTVALAQDPVPNRRPARARALMVTAAVPLAGLQAVAIVAAPGLFGLHGTGQSVGVAAIVLGATALTTSAGLAVIAAGAPRSARGAQTASAAQTVTLGSLGSAAATST